MKLKKKRRKLASEVCYGLALGVHFGMQPKEILEFVWDDFNKWADTVKWSGDANS